MDNYFGEIRAFPYGKAPVNWAACNGQALAIADYKALFGLLGTRFGGDGVKTFNLPDLRGRVILGTGEYNIGDKGGAEGVGLVDSEIPLHNHFFNAANRKGDKALTTGLSLAATPQTPAIANEDICAFTRTGCASRIALHPESIATGGSGLPHENRMPYLALQYCIALNGLYPSRQFSTSSI